MGLFSDDKTQTESKGRTFRTIEDRSEIGNFDRQVAFDAARSEWVRWSDDNSAWEVVGENDPDNPDYFRDNREPPKPVTPDLPTQDDAMEAGLTRAKDLLRRQGRAATVSRQRFADRLPKNAATSLREPTAATKPAPDSESVETPLERAVNTLTGSVKRLTGTTSGRDVTADTSAVPGAVNVLRGS